MIVDWLLNLFQTVIDGAGSLLPSWSFDLQSRVDTIASNLGALNYFLPIAETVGLVVSLLVMVPVVFGVNFALWVVMALRGGSSRG